MEKSFLKSQPVHKRSGTTDTQRLQPPKGRVLLAEGQGSAQPWVPADAIKK